MEISPNLISELRSTFLQELSAKGENSIHPKDLERVKNSDHWLERFLRHNEGNVTMAKDMMWESINWRRDFKTNDITEDNIKKDIIIQGGFFILGADKDGSPLLVFKCIKHKKGQADVDELKRCIIYWFERIERYTKGQPITIFFDMEGCGLSNMDMEITKYLIGLFKVYYPYFLNYILIFEMPWVLNAAFKIIKSWLPEKAVQKIKFIGKKDIGNWIPAEHILTSWGGTNTYQFSFIPEERPVAKESANLNNNNNNKKVHFVEGTPMSENSPSSGDKENDGGALKVHPNNVITFVKEGGELVSTLTLENSDSSTTLTFKLKTTSPEKFRVKPSTGILTPRAKATITVSLVAGYHIGGLSKDKFLIMSTILDTSEVNKDLSEIWKNTSNRKVNQIRLRCVQSGDITKNGHVEGLNGPLDVDHDSLTKLNTNMAQLTTCQKELCKAVQKTQYFQMATMFLVLLLAVVLVFVVKSELKHVETGSYCTAPPPTP